MKEIFLSVILLICMYATAENLVMNGNFASEKIEPWTVAGSKDIPIIDKKIYFSFPASIRLEPQKSSSMWVSQKNIKLAESGKYRFRAMIRGENIRAAPDRKSFGAQISMSYEDPTTKKMKWFTGNLPLKTGTFGWTEFEKEFQAKQIPGKIINITLSLNGCDKESKVWFDNIVLEEIRNSVMLFPVDFQENYWSVCTGIPGFLCIDGTGKTSEWENAIFTIKFPLGFQIVGVYHKRKPFQFPEVIRKGENFSFKIPKAMTAAMLQTHHNWGNSLYVAVAAERPGLHGKATWKLVNGNTLLREGSFQIESLEQPILPAAPLKEFNVRIDDMLSIPLLNVHKSYDAYWRGMSSSLQTRNADNRHPYVFNLPAYPAGMPPYSLYALRNEKNREFPPLVNEFGQKMPGKLVAPWYIIEDPEGYIWQKTEPTAIKEKIKDIHVDSVSINFEPRVHEYGYDIGNLERFAKFSGIKTTPSIQEVKQKYRKEWQKFRLKQNAEVVRKYAEMFRNNFPDIKIGTTCEPLRPTGDPSPNIDARLHDPYVDLHFHMIYRNGIEYFDTLEFNTKLLKKPIYPFIDPTEQSIQFYRRYSPEIVKRQILVTGALGGVGLSFFPHDGFDGRYLRAIANGFELFRRVEDFYRNKPVSDNVSIEPLNCIDVKLDSSSIKWPDLLSKLRMTMHKNEGKTLLSIFNYGNEKCIFRIPVPGVNFWEDAVSKVCYEGGIAMVDPNGEALLISAEKPTSGFRMIKSEELMKLIDVDRRKFSEQNSFRSEKKGDSSISWTTLDGKKEPMLMLQKGERYIVIAPNSELLSWGAGKNRYHGIFGRMILRDRSQIITPPYSFTLKATGFSPNPWAEFTFHVPPYDDAFPGFNPLEGVYITKRIILADNGVQLCFVFQNNHPRKMPVSPGFRIWNKLDGNMQKALIISGTNQLDSGMPESLLLAPGKLSFAPVTNETRAWKSHDNVKYINKNHELLFSGKDWAGIYLWRSQSCLTIEPISPEFILKNGESRAFDMFISKK